MPDYRPTTTHIGPTTGPVCRPAVRRGNHRRTQCVQPVVNHDDDRAGLVLAGDGHDPEDPDMRDAHVHVTDVLRAHRHLTLAPGRLRDWYQSAALTRLPDAADPG